MDVYELLQAAAYFDDLLVFGERLLAFVEAAKHHPDRAKLVKRFYDLISPYCMTDYVGEALHAEKPYVIRSGKGAMRSYIGFSLPSQTSPVTSLEQLDQYARQLKGGFLPPAGPLITEESVRSVMKQLDSRWDYSEKVFRDQPAVIGILPCRNAASNSQCLIRSSRIGIGLHLFLFHTLEDPTHPVVPEYALFHELAYALCIRSANGLALGQTSIDLLTRYFPTVLTNNYPIEQQLELLADVMAMGMMQDSPFEEFDPFVSIRQEDKQAFRAAFEQMITSL